MKELKLEKKNSFIWKYKILWLYTTDTKFPEDGY